MKEDIVNSIESIIRKSIDENDLMFNLRSFVNEKEAKLNPLAESINLKKLYAENINVLNSEQVKDLALLTGYKDIDAYVGGFLLSELVVLGGRPAMGKTQFLVNLALRLAEKNPVLYFTYDLSCFLLTNRFMSAISEIETYKILQHRLTETDKNLLTENINTPALNNIYINDSGNSSISAFRTECERQIKENGIKVIFVDFLQMMTSSRYRNNREAEVSAISRELKSIAKDNNVCVIVSSQLSRAVETRGGNKKPMLADLRDSGAIEQDADKVMFLYRPEYYGFDIDEDGEPTSGLTYLILAKNRNGRVGEFKLTRDINFSNYRDYTEPNRSLIINRSRLDELDPPF